MSLLTRLTKLEAAHGPQKGFGGFAERMRAAAMRLRAAGPLPEPTLAELEERLARMPVNGLAWRMTRRKIDHLTEVAKRVAASTNQKGVHLG
ncbi:hypothetical protein ACIPRI_14710 [Variovorax sp. LARHSF232]